jgi:hypothetical protein
MSDVIDLVSFVSREFIKNPQPTAAIILFQTPLGLPCDRPSRADLLQSFPVIAKPALLALSQVVRRRLNLREEELVVTEYRQIWPCRTLGAAGVAGAFAAVIENVAAGRLTSEEGKGVADLLDMQRKAIETGEVAEQVKLLKEKMGGIGR